MALKSMHIANKAQENIIDILDQAPEKKDLFALNAVSGTHIDKYRLLSQKSTSNISIDQVNTNLKEIRAREAVLQARLKEIRGEEEEKVGALIGRLYSIGILNVSYTTLCFVHSPQTLDL